jgi:hypothetical protein
MLPFPRHGGMVYEDRCKVVKTVKHKEKTGTYVIKIIKDPNYKLHGQMYSPAILYPHGGVSGTTGGWPTIASALKRAVEGIRESIKEEQREVRLARMSPAQREAHFRKEKLDKATRFFYAHAGGPVNQTQRKLYARQLAEAEQYANDNDWQVYWEGDPEPYEMGDAEESPPREVYVAKLVDGEGRVLTTLGGIGDPSQAYQRVVEAELVLDVAGSLLESTP